MTPVAARVEQRQQRWQRYLADVQVYAQMPQPLESVGQSEDALGGHH